MYIFFVSKVSWRIVITILKTQTVKRTEAYYNSKEADAFYKNIWGGQDIHIGVYLSDSDTILDASRRTVEHMAKKLVNNGDSVCVLDLGSGYGGSARYLASRFGCQVTCLNLSEKQNNLNWRLTKKAGLTDKIRIVHGDFENIEEADDSYQIVWSQDAILHSGNRKRVLDEVCRVLVSGGQFIFTDPMQSEKCPNGVLQPILERIQLSSLASPSFYRTELNLRGFKEVETELLTNQLQIHYCYVKEALQNRYQEAVSLSGQVYVDSMIKGLQNWIDGAERGYLTWGVMDYRLTS